MPGISVSALRPRAFDNWDFNLGATRRVKVQAYQYAKHAVTLVSKAYDSTALKRAINWLEGGIHRELNAPVLSLPIMVVDDQISILRAVATSFRALGFSNVRTFSNSNEAAAAYGGIAPAILITDLDMPGHLQGHELIDTVAADTSVTKPVFVLHSGNRATRAPMGSIAETIRRHSVITIMKGDHILADLAFQIALARVRRLPFTLPEVPKIEEPAQYDALQETPGYKITSALIHRINNIICGLMPNINWHSETPEDATLIPDIRGSANELLAVMNVLEEFLRLDLNTIEDVTRTSLYAGLKGHEQDTLINNFPLLPRHSRNNVKIPLEQLLAQGLRDMRGLLQGILDDLSTASRQITETNLERFRPAQLRLLNTLHAANLVRTGENNEQVANFAISYGLLSSTSSGSSSPSSSSA